MPDTKEGREEQAANEDRRQRERAMEEARTRADEPEPPLDEAEGGADADASDGPPECHRRDCHEPATFRALERYQEDTGHGAVEAEALLCRAHAAEERPSNLDGVYADYVFRVTPIPGTGPTDEA